MRILLIGHGYWGAKLRERFDALLGPENVLVVERDAAKIPANLPNSVYLEDFGALLNRVDACVIATPPPTHYEIARECLKAGRHCFVEKPLALCSKSAWQLLSLARDKRLSLMVDSTWLYHPGVRAALDAIRIPHPGGDYVNMSLQWANPHPATPREGILWTLGTHPVSLFLAALPLEDVHDVKVEEGAIWGPRLAIFTLTADHGTARIVLSWDTQQRVRRFIVDRVSVERNEESFAAFDDAPPAAADALTAICSHFLDACATGMAGRPQHDAYMVPTVEILEQVERVGYHERPAG